METVLAKQRKAKKKDNRDERYKKMKLASELLMIFLNGIIFKYGAIFP